MPLTSARSAVRPRGGSNPELPGYWRSWTLRPEPLNCVTLKKIYQRSRAKRLHTKTQRRAAAFVISWSRSQLFSDHCALMFTPLLVIVDTAVRKPIPCVLYVLFEPLLVIVPTVRKTTQQDIASLLNWRHIIQNWSRRTFAATFLQSPVEGI